MDHVDVGEPTEAMFADAFGLVSDPSVATHCASRFWAEAQETYVADPAAGVFRWDLGRETNHEADSGGTQGATASRALQLQACVGSGSTCVVASNNKQPRGAVLVCARGDGAWGTMEPYAALSGAAPARRR